MEEVRRGRGRPPRTQQEDAGVPHWPDEPAEVDPDMDPGFERVIVSRGRTVVIPHPTRTKLVRQDEDGRKIMAPEHVVCEEGSDIMLETAEAERLIELGIVHRPGEPQMVPAALSEGSRVVEIGTPRGQSPINQAMRT